MVWKDVDGFAIELNGFLVVSSFPGGVPLGVHHFSLLFLLLHVCRQLLDVLLLGWRGCVGERAGVLLEVDGVVDGGHFLICGHLSLGVSSGVYA